MSDDHARSTILVIGAGGFGTALALVLDANGHRVRVWGRDAELMRTIEKTRENARHLPGVELPRTIEFGSDAARLARGADTYLSVVPTQFLDATLARVAKDVPPPRIVASCSKGLETKKLRRPAAIVEEIWPAARIVVLSGPSHAEEISRGLPTAVVVASRDAEAATFVQALFHGSRFRPYTSKDPLGVEIGGMTKNIIAIACGIADGLALGDNTRAGLMTRGLREMTRLGANLGARPETFAGLSGLGDLVATCTSDHSRNRKVGLRIGRGERLADILASSHNVAEGVETTRAFHQLAHERGIYVPITNEVYEMLFEDKSPREAVDSLMCRESGEEM